MYARCKRYRSAAYVSLLVFVWPSLAHAWGPATHIDYGLEVLKNIALLSPLLRRLLVRHADDFLYGCCAADIVVGKNFAKYMYHCHNWQVGLRVLGQARSDAEAALCFGFLSHLAADIVAHNFFVPYKTVESFRTLAAKHTYWELRFDKTALEHPGVWDTLRRIGQKKFPHHDEFLSQELVHASRLFSFGTSKTLFSSMMFLSRLEQWQGLIAKVAARSPLPLTPVETTEFRHLALEAIFAFLGHAERSAALSIDPTGARSLRVAKELRRELRLAWKSGGVKDERWPQVAHDVRLRFRKGIYGDLDMPMADSLLAAR